MHEQPTDHRPERINRALPMNVVFLVAGQVVVDDEGNLLDIDTTSQQIGRDQNARGTGAELLHDIVAMGLLHVSVLESGGNEAEVVVVVVVVVVMT